jgi:hypothetical protein
MTGALNSSYRVVTTGRRYTRAPPPAQVRRPAYDRRRMGSPGRDAGPPAATPGRAGHGERDARRPLERALAAAAVALTVLGLACAGGVARTAPDGSVVAAAEELAPDAEAPDLLVSGDDEGGEDEGPPATPLVDVVVGTDRSTGVRLGTACTGVAVAGVAVGCPPGTKPTRLTLEVDSSLAPGL